MMSPKRTALVLVWFLERPGATGMIRKRIGRFLFATLLLVGAGQILFVPPALAIDRNDAQDCDAKDDPDRMISGCTRLLASRSLRAQLRAAALNNRGIAYGLKNDFDAAIADFSETLRVDPKHITAYFGRGFAYQSKGDLDRAVADYDEAIRLNPKDAVTFVRRGFAYQAKGDFDRAMADFDEAIRINPRSTDAHIGRGWTYKTHGDVDRALAEFDETIRIDPRNAAAYVHRGLIYDARGDYDRALNEYNSAIQIDPKNTAALVDRGRAYFKKNYYDRAIADLSEAIRLNPKLADAIVLRGVAYQRKGDFDRALIEFGEAIRIAPESLRPHTARADAYTERGDYDRAIADCNEAIRLDPKKSELYHHRANAYSAKGDTDRAIADYDEAIRLDPEDPEPLTGRGLVYERQAEIAKARADYSAALNAAQRSETEKQAKIKARERLAALSDAPAPPAPAAAPAIMAAVVPAAPVAVNDHRIALVIGNSAYENVPALPNPARDAALVADTLKRTGFETVMVQTNLRRDALITALRDFAARAESADWAVVYYAGHGMEVGGVNYLIPIDAKIAADRDIGFEAVPLEQVLNAAERAKKLRLVILDACRDNPFASKMRRTLNVASRSVTRGLAAVEPDAGTLVVYAAKDGETAIDGDGGNSPFALAFIKNLKTPGLEVRRLFDYVRDDVMDATSRKQQPFSYGSISGRQDFYFVAGK